MSPLAALDRLLPPGSRQRALVLGGASLLAALLLVTLGLPRLPPGGVWATRIAVGCGDALLATGLVLVWRSARVVNFAQSAMGAVPLYLAGILMAGFRVSALLVVPLCVLIGALTGFLINAAFIQRFFNSPRLVVTVATIVIAQSLNDPKHFIDAIPIFGDASNSLKVRERMENGTATVPFHKWTGHLFGIPVTSATVMCIALALCALTGLALWLRRSRMGTAVRGVAVNAERAQSLGINVRAVGMVIWTISGALAALGLVLPGLVTNGAARAVASPAEYLIPALAAVVLARMSSIPTAVVASLAISLVSGAVTWAYPSSPWVEVGLFGIIAVGLLLQRRNSGRTEEADSSSWEATKEIRPIPKELAVVPEVGRTRRALIAVLAVVILVVPFTVSSPQANLFALIFIEGMIGLSIVVLTGWSGTISLGQFALVAIAAVAAGNLTTNHGISFWVALPLVAAFTGGLAMVLGIPALRIRGPFLAVTTLAMALAAERLLFRGPLFRHVIPDHVDRPRLLFISLASERNYYFLCLAMLVLSILVVRGLRHSRTGRVLIAARENEAGVEAFGVSLVRTRLAAFGVSGILAGMAGVLYAHHQRSITPDAFAASASVDMFVMAMIGGIGTTSGAVLGATYIGIVHFTIRSEVVRNLATNGGLLALLLLAPGGLAQLMTQARDSLLRIVALRRNIPVPSLFEDADIDAIVNRRAPLVARIPFRGLEVIPRRYTRPSALHGRPTERQEAPA
jgi:branched-chain amino acid transport system permease protein